MEDTGELKKKLEVIDENLQEFICQPVVTLQELIEFQINIKKMIEEISNRLNQLEQGSSINVIIDGLPYTRFNSSVLQRRFR